MVRMVLYIAAHNKWYVHQMDVMSTFFNGYSEEALEEISTQNGPPKMN